MTQSSAAARDALVELSVVIATHRGEQTLSRALDSLASQSLDVARFEVIVVINGDVDSSPGVVEAFGLEHPSMTVRIVQVLDADAAGARNWGVSSAMGEHVTFLDDDDHLSPNYLEGLLDHAAPGVVPVAYIGDVQDDRLLPDAFIPSESYFNNVLIPHAGKTVDVQSASPALSANVGKLVPRAMALAHPYPTGLRSGEDVVFWTRLFVENGFRFAVLPTAAGAMYYRMVRSNSLSRQPMGFDFNVAQRLDVIALLSKLEPMTAAGRMVVIGKTRTQVRWIREYLDAVPEDRERVEAAIKARRIRNFPYFVLNRGRATELALLYAYLPFQDTSALVAAKRIRTRGAVVDVISNNLDQVRAADPYSLEIAAEFVDEHRQLDVGQAFSNWIIMRRYAKAALRQAMGLKRKKQREYEAVYSRAMWGASHVAAALYKIRHPDVPWVAELSDPLVQDVEGRARREQCADDGLLQEFRAAITAAGFEPPTGLSVWEWIEAVTYALADELVFTNDSQRDFMLENFYSTALAERARALAVVDPQPTLPHEFYHRREADYPLEPGLAHIGYFGVFYATRGISMVAEGMAALKPQERSRLRLHVFTNDPADTRLTAAQLGLSDIVRVHAYRPYFEFLNLTTRVDVLLVQDATSIGIHSRNPYLPSKLSDYVGSGSDIWAVAEQGSELSRLATRYKSDLGDVAEVADVLRAIGSDHGSDRP